jgi:thiol-disulfide isomerase/thioredoxin
MGGAANQPSAENQEVNIPVNASEVLIEAAHNRSPTIRHRSMCAAGIFFLGLMIGLSDRAVAQQPSTDQVADKITETPEEYQYFVTGAVREQGTENPVAGAKVQFLDSSAQDPQQRLRIGVTDAQGRYRIAVPMGGIRLWFPELKPGYWMGAKESMHEVVTSPETPVAEHDLIVRKAPVWHVTLDGGVPLLTFRTQSVEPIAVQKLSGQIVDASGAPLAAARIGVAGGQDGRGSSVWESFTHSAADGRFTLDVPIQAYAEKMKLEFSAIVNKEGFAGTDTPFAECSADYGAIDVGTIKLSPGYSTAVRVVDADGNPLAGAEIEPARGYSLRRQAVRSGPDGHAVIRDLPKGVVRVAVRHGGQLTSTNLFVGEDVTNKNATILRLSKPATPPAAGEKRAKPLAIGSVAPDWSLQGWSDGESRKLVDYRGKVVVIDFWGVWCGPCLSSIPALQQLADKYDRRGVVFVGIHTADGSIEQINQLKELRSWTTPSGLDVGTSITDSATCRSYGVGGFPTIVVVDEEGRIAYRTDIQPEDRDQFMKEMGEFAKSLEIPWPPKNDAPREEMEAMMNKLMVANISREIDRVLD